MLVSSSCERPTPHGCPARVPDLLGPLQQVVVRVGPVGISRLRPPVLVPVAGVGRVGVRKGEVLLGLRVVRRLVREIDLLPVLLLDLLVHVRHVDDLGLVGRRRRQEHEEVVSLLRRDLRGGPGGEVHQVDVVHDDVRVVLLAPFLGVGAVEPRVPGRNEMAPLDDLERLLLGGGPFGKQEGRSGCRGEGGSAREGYEVPPGHPRPRLRFFLLAIAGAPSFLRGTPGRPAVGPPPRARRVRSRMPASGG